jgi:hypothetical protein
MAKHDLTTDCTSDNSKLITTTKEHDKAHVKATWTLALLRWRHALAAVDALLPNYADDEIDALMLIVNDAESVLRFLPAPNLEAFEIKMRIECERAGLDNAALLDDLMTEMHSLAISPCEKSS